MLMPGFCVDCARVNAHTKDCPTGKKMLERDARIEKLELELIVVRRRLEMLLAEHGQTL